MLVTERDAIAMIRELERKTAVVCGDDGGTRWLDLENAKIDGTKVNDELECWNGGRGRGEGGSFRENG